MLTIFVQEGMASAKYHVREAGLQVKQGKDILSIKKANMKVRLASDHDRQLSILTSLPLQVEGGPNELASAAESLPRK